MKLESLGAVRERERERERELYFNEIKKANKINKGVLCLNVDRHKVTA